MEYESRFGKEYTMKPVTKDEELWKYKEFEEYKIQETAFLCCCLHIW